MTYIDLHLEALKASILNFEPVLTGRDYEIIFFVYISPAQRTGGFFSEMKQKQHYLMFIVMN